MNEGNEKCMRIFECAKKFTILLLLLMMFGADVTVVG